MGCIIGIDTSCYTTSVACVDENGQILGSFRKLLTVGDGQRGLRQSEGVFQHVKQLPQVAEEMFHSIGRQPILAVGVSASPRDGEDSYMPVFAVGSAHARTLAAALQVPCYASTHQRGHVRAAQVDSGLESGPFLAVHLSGGTTEMLAMNEGELLLLGGTRDLHAGQLVDRVGVHLGLPFPAGPHLEKLALEGESCALLPASMAEGDLYCHFSGAETKLVTLLRDGQIKPFDAAMEVYDLLGRTIARMLIAGAKKTGYRQGLVAGGVASSALFRKVLLKRVAKIDRGFKVYFGKPEYSGDNAVGAALLALERFKRGENGVSSTD
ncbi:MAG: O-sialoglycoprotein endopeptidase [Clostridia bacterium]|nr:O-sialoglycoprotein endopeptidase [Clostridia bacterium]